jgi:NADH-quinone oxidoreductase subunit M
MSTFPWLTVLTLLPIFGGVTVVGLPSDQRRLARALSLAVSAAVLAATLLLWFQFSRSSSGFQFAEAYDWIPALGIRYIVGVDGLGMLMVLLTAIVVPMALLASGGVEERTPLYFGLVLFLQAGLIGTFTALNFFHWFLFWELSLVPAFFLIRLWGGAERSRAATQFFVYTMVGSVAMLLAFLAIFLATHVSDFLTLAAWGREGALHAALADHLGWKDLTVRRLSLVIFSAAFLGFAVKVPLVPFHTWLPLAYAEAPTGTTMLLTGLMSKMGVYGFLRVLLPIFPQEMRWLSTPLLLAAVVTIIYSAFAALAQRDLKRMLAYSSVNHLGYCLLGVFAVLRSTSMSATPLAEKAAALDGVLLQMFNHGLTAATLFWFVGMLEQRAGGLRGIGDFGGIRKVAPVFCGLMGMALFSSLGLPGLNGFVGEFLIFKGAFPLAPWAAAMAVVGLLVTAVFILTILQRVFSGPLNPRWAGFPDLTAGERWMLAPAIGLMFLLGVYPQAVLGVVNSTILEMVQQLKF